MDADLRLKIVRDHRGIGLLVGCPAYPAFKAKVASRLAWGLWDGFDRLASTVNRWDRLRFGCRMDAASRRTYPMSMAIGFDGLWDRTGRFVGDRRNDRSGGNSPPIN